VKWRTTSNSETSGSAGGDWRRVDGDSEEDAYLAAPGVPIVPPTARAVLSLRRISGGTQRSLGVFVQDVFTPVPKLVLTVSARVDNWRNFDGHIRETTVATGLPGAGNRPTLADTSDRVGSPRVAALYHITDRVTAWGDLSWGFRAPTLNELYRQFNVGLVRTLANDGLGPERLTGGEAGLRVQPVSNVSLRATWYENRVKNPVSNVTIGTNLQQRQNLGRTRIRGLQTDVDVRAGSSLKFSAGYLYNDARVRAFAANPVLVGRYLPQVTKQRGSVSAVYSNPRYVTASVSALLFGRQFDDDLNARVTPGQSAPGLPSYGVLEMTAMRSFGRNLDAFFGVQNLLDQEYIVGLLPTTIGSPRLVNGGIRVRWAGQ